jgi:hypothetical protein
MSEKEHFEEPKMPAGGWGSASTTTSLLRHEHVLFKGGRIIIHQNKPHGYAYVSCSWAKPAHPHAIEACEKGIKATAWEITEKRTPLVGHLKKAVTTYYAKDRRPRSATHRELPG